MDFGCAIPSHPSDELGMLDGQAHFRMEMWWCGCVEGEVAEVWGEM